MSGSLHELSAEEGDDKAAMERGASVATETLSIAGLPARDRRYRRPPLFQRLLAAQVFRDVSRVISLIVLDVLAVVLGLLSGFQTRRFLNGSWDLALPSAEALGSVPLAVFVVTLLFARSGLYRERAFRPGFSQVFSGLLQATAVLLLFSLLEGRELDSYYIFYGSLIFAVIFVVLFRDLYDRAESAILRATRRGRRTVLVGARDRVDLIIDRLARDPTGAEGLGYPVRRETIGPESLGTLDRRLGPIDQVIVVEESALPADRARFAELCHLRGIKFRLVPSAVEPPHGRLQFVGSEQLPIVEFKPYLLDGLDYYLKRSFDVTVAGLLLVLLAPLLGAISLAIKLSSPGPVLYRSWRPGLGERSFACLKFRTMRSAAGEVQANLEEPRDRRPTMFKLKDDPRVTKVGKLLRRASFDELPQLVNVMRGDMSLVGPRPIPQRDFDNLEEHHKRRYQVLPGITGLWQVSGRGQVSVDDMVVLDLLYVENWSLWDDVSILVKTLPAVVRARGAF